MVSEQYFNDAKLSSLYQCDDQQSRLKKVDCDRKQLVLRDVCLQGESRTTNTQLDVCSEKEYIQPFNFINLKEVYLMYKVDCREANSCSTG